MQAMQLLLERNSHSKLVAPAPEPPIMQKIYQAALRAPDHAGLTPWRLIEFSGAGLEKLGQMFVKAKVYQEPNTSLEDQNRLAALPLRAPLVIAVIARVQEHPKIPAIEQVLSAGCVAYGLVLAAQAQGFAAIWRSGLISHDKVLHQAMGLQTNEELVGFIYLGTPTGEFKTISHQEVHNFVQEVK